MLVPLNSPLFLNLILLCLSRAVYAQQTGLVRADEAGQLAATIGLGAANYSGDLNKRMRLRPDEIGFALAVGVMYRLTDRLSARADARLVQLKGSQRGTVDEAGNLSFRSLNPELTGGLQLDLRRASSKPTLNVYAVAGGGFTYLSPATRYQGRWVRLPPLHTEGVDYSRLVALAYGGLGVSVRLPRRLLLSVELGYTLPASDYIDDVSTVYPYAGTLSSPEAVTLSDRRPEQGLPPHNPGERRGFSPGTDRYLTGLFRLTVPLSSAKERKCRRNMNCAK